MNTTATGQLVTLAELVAEGFGQSMFAPPSIDYLAGQLGDAVVLDDIGRRCVTRETARQLFTERAQQQAAKAAAAAERKAHAQAEERQRAAHQAAIEARHQRQRELVAQGWSAAEVMFADNGEHDRRMEAKGEQFEDLLMGRSSGAFFTQPAGDQ